jgi:predicted nucleic acid-binding protein
MSLVLDASGAVNIVTGRDPGHRLSSLVAEAELVRAPDLIVSELTNTFWKYQRLGGVSRDQCSDALLKSMALVDVLVPTAELYEEVFDLACRTSHPAYDLFYLVLARRHAAILVTADRKLEELAREHQVRTS